jgi:hypothetical protein
MISSLLISEDMAPLYCVFVSRKSMEIERWFPNSSINDTGNTTDIMGYADYPESPFIRLAVRN